jgi:uncharacterized protein (DUF2062 family)
MICMNQENKIWWILYLFKEIEVIMSFQRKIKSFLEKAVKSGASPKIFALSFSIGIYIAFSPFPGAHTIMVVASMWLFKLNPIALFVGASLNNPWTMIPFFSFDYFFGYWLVHSVFDFQPGWIISLAKIFGFGNVCLWSFIIGGNVLGIGCALISYPLMKIFFKKYIEKSASGSCPAR